LHSDKIGGIEGLKAKLSISHPESLNFLPKLNGAGSAVGSYALGIGAFLAFVGVQWWASWYPGGEPGGGGYVAQRMMSAKNEKHSIFATLFFNIAHYCLRPWPWILVGLCALVLYPNLHEDQYRLGYVMAMREFLPSGLKGLMLVAFLAAYMSTISTQLNWGASYIVNDLYKRFMKRENSFSSDEAAQKHYVMISRVVTIITMFIALGVTPLINSISGVWGFIMECGAGLGLVLILRWYWWRINAWSEISATIIPFVVFGGIKLMEHIQLNAFHDQLGYAAGQEMSKDQFRQFYDAHPMLSFPGSFFLTVGITTVGWIIVTFMTRPENATTLRHFYERVRPGGAWKPVQQELGLTATPARTFGLVMCWLSAVLMTYSILFMSGKIIFHEWSEAGWCAGVALVSFVVLRFFVGRTRIFED
jgi:Na+/proline symporter